MLARICACARAYYQNVLAHSSAHSAACMRGHARPPKLAALPLVTFAHMRDAHVRPEKARYRAVCTVMPCAMRAGWDDSELTLAGFEPQFARPVPPLFEPRDDEACAHTTCGIDDRPCSIHRMVTALRLATHQLRLAPLRNRSTLASVLNCER